MATQFSDKFVARLAEQVAITFLISFGAIALAGPSLTLSTCGAALTGSLRAVYGLLVSRFGDPDAPNLR